MVRMVVIEDDDDYSGTFGGFDSYDQELLEAEEARENPRKSKKQRERERERALTDSLGGAMLRDPFDEE